MFSNKTKTKVSWSRGHYQILINNWVAWSSHSDHAIVWEVIILERQLSELFPGFVRTLFGLIYYSDCHCVYMYYLSIHYPEADNCRLISLLIYSSVFLLRRVKTIGIRIPIMNSDITQLSPLPWYRSHQYGQNSAVSLYCGVPGLPCLS